ncbi:MAG: tetratricopeptide repeat protein [Bacteroidota bacterium]
MKPKSSLRWLWFPLVVPFALHAQSLEDGMAYYSKGQFGEAKKVFESIVKQDDNNAEAHYRLGRVLMIRAFRDEDSAVDHMERAVELNPNSADYQYGLGAAYGTKAQNAGFIKQAFLAPKVKSAFLKAVELDPKHVEAHIGLAQYYQQAPGIMGGDNEKAWKEADVIVQLDEVRGRAFKAGLYLADKKMPEAERELTTLTTNRAKDWRAWRAAGSFYLRNQRSDDAIAVFQKYVELRPDTSDSHARLAQAYLQKKEADLAMSAAKKAVALEKDSFNAVSFLAYAHELKGQKKEARENYERLLSMDLNPDQKKNVEQKIKELQN